MIFFPIDKQEDKNFVGPTEFLSEKQRIVYVNEIVNTPTGNAIDTAPYYLLALNEENSDKTIRLLIDSAGGAVPSFLFIYDVLIAGIKAPVYTLALSRCRSAAILPFIAGKKSKRFCLPHTEFILHYPQPQDTPAQPFSIKELLQPKKEGLEPKKKKDKNDSNILCVPDELIMRGQEERLKNTRELLKIILRVHLKPDKVEDIIKRLDETGRLNVSPEEALDVGIADEILTKENRNKFFDQ